MNTLIPVAFVVVGLLLAHAAPRARRGQWRPLGDAPTCCPVCAGIFFCSCPQRTCPTATLEEALRDMLDAGEIDWIEFDMLIGELVGRIVAEVQDWSTFDPLTVPLDLKGWVVRDGKLVDSQPRCEKCGKPCEQFAGATSTCQACLFEATTAFSAAWYGGVDYY